MRRLVVLELNEVNFDFVKRYTEMGKLPAFKRLFDRCGYDETTSESKYEELEPWIQWVTAHTGLSFAEHKLFRLGDIRNSDIIQIWEHLEREFGLKVAAISPMNADNRTKAAAFFVPDPWTGGTIDGPQHLARLYSAISTAVNENAKEKTNLTVYWNLLIGLIRYGRVCNYKKYLSFLLGSLTGKWRKALILDRLLADVFLLELRKHEPDFATLFVNAAAHIQHHYMFSSAVYDGGMRNPDWYIRTDVDPLLEVYELYDQIVSEVLALPETRLIIMTGLHQDPYESATFYYRLADHAAFLKKIGVEYQSVEPLMSRDFLIRFSTTREARKAAVLLKDVKSADGEEMFYVDNRGLEIFSMLVYSKEIGRNFSISVGDRKIEEFLSDVSFVALKNGQHNGVGYFVDSDRSQNGMNRQFPLSDVFDLIVESFQDAR
jgi:glutaredoxin-related protein